MSGSFGKPMSKFPALLRKKTSSEEQSGEHALLEKILEKRNVDAY